jgi:hypothetical protein
MIKTMSTRASPKRAMAAGGAYYLGDKYYCFPGL